MMIFSRRVLRFFAVFGFLVFANVVMLSNQQDALALERFVTYKYTDPMTGMEAFRLLVPKGWRVEGAITWSKNPALPAQSRFRFYNPSGPEEMNLFPTRSYFWTNNQLFLRTNPPGSLRFNSLVAKPIDLHAAFTQVVIPKARKNVSDLVILKEKNIPELSRLAAGNSVQGLKSSAQGGKVRIGYQERGKRMEEELYAAVSQFVIYPEPRYFINYWYIDYVFSFRAEKGKLDSRAKTFQTMLFSMKINPKWYAKVVNVKEMLAQKSIKEIKAIGRMGDIIAKAGSQMREDQMRAWEQRQQVQDKISQNTSDQIRGVDRYYDSRAGKEVELPSGYGHAWSNNLGEYYVTDKAGDNPNIGSNLHWEQLTPAR